MRETNRPQTDTQGNNNK